MYLSNSKNNQHLPELFDLSQLEIREYKATDKYNVFQILNEFRRDFLIAVYKKCFKSWFSYIITAFIMCILYTIFDKSIPTLFISPLIVTTYILYKVNKYRGSFKLLSIYDLENMVLESTSIKRRKQQGVYVCVLKHTVVAYCVYLKQDDEIDAVRIKELCVLKAYRNKGVAKYLVNHLTETFFKNYKYSRFVFTLSNYHDESISYCNKHNIKQTDSWDVYTFLPGVKDSRTAYTVEFQ